MRGRLLVVILLGAVMATVVQMRFPYLNGPWYYTWLWQRQQTMQVFWPMVFAGMLPMLAGLVVYQRSGRRDWPLFLTCLSLVIVTLSVSVMEERMGGFERTIRIVRSPGATSYFTAAREYFINRGMGLMEFLGRYKELQHEFFLHAQTKPAGPIVYYWAWVSAFGAGMGTALAAGLFQLVLTCASVLATSWMVSTVTGEKAAGIYAAAALIVCPATIVFYPGFDSVYPAVACGMVGTWVMAVRTRRWQWAAAYGATLALALFLTYILLLVGAFLAGYAIVASWRKPLSILRHAAIAIGIVLAIYGLAYLLTGYSAWGAYKESKRLLDDALTWVRRPYPSTIGWDLYDFTLGMGWVSLAMAIAYLARGWRAVGWEMWWVTVLALISPIIVAVSYLVPGETSRCWQVLIPLVLIPVGAELSRWDRAGRLTYYVVAIAVLAAVAGRMSFISTEPIDKLIEMGQL